MDQTETRWPFKLALLLLWDYIYWMKDSLGPYDDRMICKVTFMLSGIYNNSRSITQQAAKHIKIGDLAGINYYSLADLNKIQEDIDVSYFTKRILDQDLTGK